MVVYTDLGPLVGVTHMDSVCLKLTELQKTKKTHTFLLTLPL